MGITVVHGGYGSFENAANTRASMQGLAKTKLATDAQRLSEEKFAQDIVEADRAADQWQQGYDQRGSQFDATLQQRGAQFDATMQQRQSELAATQQHRDEQFLLQQREFEHSVELNRAQLEQRAEQLKLQQQEFARSAAMDQAKLEQQRLSNALTRGLVENQEGDLAGKQRYQELRNSQAEIQLERDQFDLQQARERDAILKEDRDALNSYFGANGLGLTPGKDFEEAFPSAASLYAFQQLPKSSRDQWLKARAQQLEVQKRDGGAGVLMHNAEGQAVLSDRFDQEQAKAIIQSYQAGELSDAEAQEALLIEGRKATFLDQKASVMEMVRAGYEQATSLNGAQMTGLDQEELEAVMRELSKAQFDPRAGYDQYDFTSIVVP
jgi:hypothetical protein